MRKWATVLTTAAALAALSGCGGDLPAVPQTPDFVGIADGPVPPSQLRNGLLGRADLSSTPSSYHATSTTTDDDSDDIASDDSCDRQGDIPDGTGQAVAYAEWKHPTRGFGESVYSMSEDAAKQYMRTMRGNTCSDDDGGSKATFTDRSGIGDEALQATVKDEEGTTHVVVARTGGLLFMVMSAAKSGTPDSPYGLAEKAIETMHHALRP